MSIVSILVPNYNGAAHLPRCLDSVRAQTVDDWNLVIGDNASTDSSLSIARGLREPRIRVVRRPRTIGWVANVNLLLAEVAAPYVAILHADDWWEPDFLEATVGMLEAARDSLVATCVARVVRDGRTVETTGLGRTRSTIPAGEVARLLTKRNLMPAVTVLARAELYQRFPRYEPALPLLGDWLMWLRAGTVAPFEVTDQVLANYRVHDANQSTAAEVQNLWAMDLLRVGRILQAEWSGPGAPYPGAAAAIAGAVADQLLVRAVLRLEAGDAGGARLLARLGWANAPGIGQRAVARMVGLGLRLSSPRTLSAMRPKLRWAAQGITAAMHRGLI